MIIAFLGHSAVASSDKIKEIVKEQIRNSFIGHHLTICYLGGYLKKIYKKAARCRSQLLAYRCFSCIQIMRNGEGDLSNFL